MNVSAQALDLLNHQFQLSHFRPGQQQVIDALLSGHSALAVFPTGGGKSLCYQLPALLFDGITLVVSPLIALMKDQVDYLQSRGIAAARFDSSLAADEVKHLYASLQQGQIKILYVAPERLSNQKFIQRIRHLTIALLAIDEAHCISDWGHKFRPDYLKLAALSQELNIQRILALTATATPAVSQDICQRFKIKAQHHIQTGFYRPNLTLLVNPQPINTRRQFLLSRLRSAPEQASIIYVTLQKTAESVAEFLMANGLSASAYHAGMTAEQRNQIQDDFMASRCHIIVATIAFGMGIDKADIRAVYHYNLPKALENYMQEIGRAGRDGLPANCELLADIDDLTVLENFTYGDTPDDSALAGVIHWIMKQAEQFSLSNYRLSQEFDIRPLVLNTLLTYLELGQVIKATSPFYSEYKLQFLQPQQQVIQHFAGERAEFLQQLFATGKPGRVWLNITLADAAIQLQQPQLRITKALQYLEQQQLITMQVSGLMQGYEKLNQQLNMDELLQQQQTLFAQRESRDLARLHRVTQWIESEQCYNQPLMSYFGDINTQACGHCSYCAGEGKKQLGVLTNSAPDKQFMLSVLQQTALTSPRQLTRFLCGINSPQLTKSKLSRHPQFGCYQGMPFAAVLQLANYLFLNQ